MRALFLTIFLIGLVLEVVSMLAGIDRDQRRRRWVPYLNLPIAGIAATFFGLVGYPLVKYSHLGDAAILAIALAAASVGAVGMMILIAGWAVPSAAREVDDVRFQLQGHVGRVTRAITEHDPGEMTYQQDGERHAVCARSVDGSPIPEQAEVVIERVEDGIAYVELWSTIERQLELPSS